MHSVGRQNPSHLVVIVRGEYDHSGVTLGCGGGLLERLHDLSGYRLDRFRVRVCFGS